MILRIALCDDDTSFRKRIKNEIVTYAKKKDVTVEFREVSISEANEEALWEFLEEDIFFICAGGKKTPGFSFAEQIHQMPQNALIVLLATTSVCAWDGYYVGALRCYKKRGFLRKKLINECMDAIYEQKESEQKVLTIRFLSGEKTFLVNRLIYVESRLHKLHFFIWDEEIEEYVTYEKLNHLEKELSGLGFVRTHQSFLVNLRFVHHMEKAGLVLWNKTSIDISRTRRDSVRKTYARYLENLQ